MSEATEQNRVLVVWKEDDPESFWSYQYNPTRLNKICQDPKVKRGLIHILSSMLLHVQDYYGADRAINDSIQGPDTETCIPGGVTYLTEHTNFCTSFCYRCQKEFEPGDKVLCTVTHKVPRFCECLECAAKRGVWVPGMPGEAPKSYRLADKAEEALDKLPE